MHKKNKSKENYTKAHQNQTDEIWRQKENLKSNQRHIANYVQKNKDKKDRRILADNYVIYNGRR